MEWFIAFLMVAPAFYLAATRSSYLLDYVFFVVALNRGIRRLVDYFINGAFNPFSPISVTPLVVSMLVLLPALARFNNLTPRTRNIAMLMMVALAHGTAIGLVNVSIGVLYPLGEWLAGFGAFLYVATAPVPIGTMDRWIKASGYSALVVALYGWYQYFTIPPWDAFWVVAVKFVGYLGNLKPMEMSVFSTLQERGPCAAYLAWAAIPMILSRRWRIFGGWLTVLLLLSTVLLTMSRTMFLIVALVVGLQPLLSKGRGMGSVLLMMTILLVGGSVGLTYMPGSERIQKRFDTVKDMQNDGSFKGRVKIFTEGAPWVLQHPLGLGLGSSGFGASRIGGKAQEGFMDSGYIEIFSQFGWLGGAAFFGALGQIWSELSQRVRRGGREAFLFTGRTVLLGCMVFLCVGNIFAGFSLFWVLLGLSLNRATLPAPVEQPRWEPQPLEAGLHHDPQPWEMQPWETQAPAPSATAPGHAFHSTNPNFRIA